MRRVGWACYTLEYTDSLFWLHTAEKAQYSFHYVNHFVNFLVEKWFEIFGVGR